MNRKLGELFLELADVARTRLQWSGTPDRTWPPALLRQLAGAAYTAETVEPADLAAAFLYVSNPKGQLYDPARLHHRLFCAQVAALLVVHYRITNFGSPARLIEAWTTLERRLSLNSGYALATQLKADLVELQAADQQL